MKRVLITGIDSFTGHHLTRHLEKAGYEVCGTSLCQEDGERVFRCDVTQEEELERIFERMSVDYVIHLAAIAFVGHGDPEAFYRVNTMGTMRLLDTLASLPVPPKKTLLASSSTVYGNQGVEVLDESLCPKPANHYGASKYAMESLAENYREQLPLIVTRPFNYTGLGQAEHFLIPKIVAHYRRGEKTIRLGNLHVIREFNDVAYVCEAYRRLLEEERAEGVVNIASGKGTQLMDIIETMDRLAGYEMQIEVDPAFVRKNEIHRLIGSPERLISLVGEIPRKPLETMLREIYEA